MNNKDIAIKPNIAIPNNGRPFIFKSFNITDVDIALGLRHIKAKVRYKFRHLAKRYHPDTNRHSPKAAKFKELDNVRKRILGLKIMPLTLDNLEIVLDIAKGYISTHDIILPWD